MRKPVLVLTVLLFFVSALAAGTASVRIGYITGFEKSAFDACFESALSLVASKGVPAFESAAGTRLGREAKKSAEAQHHRSLLALDFKAVKEIPEIAAIEVFSIEKLTLPEAFEASSLTGEEALYFMRTNGIDVLFLLKGEEEGPLLDYTLTCFIGEEEEELLSRLSVIDNPSAEFLPLLDALSSRFLPTYALVSIESGDATLEIEVDDEEEIPVNSTLLLSSGLHTFSYFAYGAVSSSEVLYLESGSHITIAPSLEKASFPPVMFSSVPSFASISVMGGEGVEGYLYQEEQIRPFSISADAPGFANLGLQISSPAIYNCLELKPEWMEDKTRLRTAKDEMYAALRNTLIAFGADVAVCSLERIYPEFAPSSLPFKVTFTSVAVISLFDFLYKCGRYYRTAENTYH
jgi:hypothetical protein